jgi:hypothetical protein
VELAGFGPASNQQAIHEEVSSMKKEKLEKREIRKDKRHDR